MPGTDGGGDCSESGGDDGCGCHLPGPGTPAAPLGLLLLLFSAFLLRDGLRLLA